MADLKGFNNNVLSKLLVRFGMRKDDFAKSVGFKVENVEKWFRNESTPTYIQLCTIADYFKKSVIIFFMDDPMLDNYAVKLRSSREFLEVEDKKRLVELIDIASSFQYSIRQMFGKNLKQSELVNFSKNHNLTKDEELCVFLRQKLDLDLKKQILFKKSSDLIEYIREKFYELGIYIYKESFRLENVSGICLYDECAPIILINNKVSFTRQLFTIFHEVYHLYLKTSNISILQDLENSCNEFASKFLIPEDDFKKCVDKLQQEKVDFEEDKSISRLADRYKVSSHAVVVRLEKAGLVSKDFCFQFLNANNQYLRTRQDDVSGGNYYFTKMNYLGKAYLQDAVSKYFMGTISINKLSQYTQMKSTSAKTMIAMMSGGKF